MPIKKIKPPRLVQWAQSNIPIYEKSFEMVNLAHFEKLGIQYDVWKENVRRNTYTHGRCPGGRKGRCHHCDTIGAASKEYWDFFDNGGMIV